MLKGLVVLNLAASAAHFAHNAAFFNGYPEPEWSPGAWFVVLVWLIIAPVLVWGYRWFERGLRIRALVAIIFFCAISLLGLGHYLYGSPGELSFLTNLFILAEAAAAVSLIGFSVVHVVRARPRPPDRQAVSAQGASG